MDFSCSIKKLITHILPRIIQQDRVQDDLSIKLKFSFDQRVYSGRREVLGALTVIGEKNNHSLENIYPVFIYLGEENILTLNTLKHVWDEFDEVNKSETFAYKNNSYKCAIFQAERCYN